MLGFGGLIVLHRLLQRRGFTVGPAEAQSGVVVLPTLRNLWWMLTRWRRLGHRHDRGRVGVRQPPAW